jgi:hypothetical protein
MTRSRHCLGENEYAYFLTCTIDGPTHVRHSSARNYAGLVGLFLV